MCSRPDIHMTACHRPQACEQPVRRLVAGCDVNTGSTHPPPAAVQAVHTCHQLQHMQYMPFTSCGTGSTHPPPAVVQAVHIHHQLRYRQYTPATSRRAMS